MIGKCVKLLVYFVGYIYDKIVRDAGCPKLLKGKLGAAAAYVGDSYCGVLCERHCFTP